MKLSTKGRYGLRAMVDLGIYSEREPVSISSIAQRQQISDRYLEQLIGKLKKAGLVSSSRGAQGGYQLAHAPEAITVGDIIDATEGPLNISECISDEGCCSLSGQCRTSRVWEYLSNSINNVLQSITLRDMLEQDRLDALTQEMTKE